MTLCSRFVTKSTLLADNEFVAFSVGCEQLSWSMNICDAFNRGCIESSDSAVAMRNTPFMFLLFRMIAIRKSSVSNRARNESACYMSVQITCLLTASMDSLLLLRSATCLNCQERVVKACAKSLSLPNSWKAPWSGEGVLQRVLTCQHMSYLIGNEVSVISQEVRR